MNSLQYNQFSKHELRFRPDGTFRILMMSDLQETLNYDPRTLAGMHKLIDSVQPDFIFLCGDNCDGTVLKTPEELNAYLDLFTAPMESRKIPWAHVFGNHDHDMEFDDLVKTGLYEKYDYCVSKHTESIPGTTNFVLPIKHSDRDETAFHIWGLDTNNRSEESNLPLDPNVSQLKLPVNSSVWDVLRFEQLMWYWNSSVELEQANGKKTDGILFMHIAPWEFQTVVDNPELCGTTGSTVERMSLGRYNSGIFSTVLQRGEIKCIACGHSHEDSFCGSYAGITVCLDACAGYSPYGIDSLRGGRVFVLNETDTSNIQTYMVSYSNL